VPVARSLSFFFFWRAPSDISPPVASPSLVEPMPDLDFPAAPGGRGVPERLGCIEAPDDFFSFFLRELSVPLDSERFGDPGRFRDLPFFAASTCFCLPEGVRVPLADPALSLPSPLRPEGS
jgi:hypothetical protein